MRKLKNESLFNNGDHQPLYPTASKVEAESGRRVETIVWPDQIRVDLRGGEWMSFVVMFHFVMSRTIKNKKKRTQKRMVPNRKRKTVKNNLTTFYARNDREKKP